MIWLRAAIPFAIPLAVIALLWTVPVPADAIPASEGLSTFVGRSIGLGLLALALLAIGFIFHSVRNSSAPEREPPSPMALARHEFRRGFGSGRLSAPRQARERDASVVVALPRGEADLSAPPRSAAPRSRPQESIENLTKRLHERVGTLWNPRVV